MNDQALLEAYGMAQDERAFEDLVRRHFSLVYGVAYQALKDHELVEELCQNVFVALGRAARKRLVIQSIPAWLYAVTRKQTVSAVRAEKRRRNRERKAAELVDHGQEADGSVVADEHLEALREGLAALNLRDQKVLFLRFFEERSLSEVGRCLGIREKAAQKRVERAVERLRQTLSKRRVVLSAGMFGAPVFTSSAAQPSAKLIDSVIRDSLVELGKPAVWTLPAMLSSNFVRAILLVSAGLALTVPVMWVREAKQPSSSSDSTSRSRSMVLQRGVAKGDSLSIAIDDIEAIYRLPPGERERALVRLTRYLERRALDRAYFTDLFERWSRLDPLRNADALVALFRKSAEDEERSRLLGELLEIPVRAGVRGSRDAMLAWVAERPRTDYSEAYAFEALVKVLAESDIAQAYARAVERPYNRDRVFEILAEKLASLPQGQALTLLDSFSDDDRAIVYASNLGDEQTLRQEAGRSKERLLQHTLPRLYERDSQALGDWIVTRETSRHTAAMIAQLMALWGKEDPRAAAEWTLELPDDYQVPAQGSLVSGWAAEAPEAALAWSLSLNAESRSHAAASAFGVWISEADQWPRAKAWLNEQIGVSGLESLFGQLAEELPAIESYHWANGLPSGSHRLEAMQHAFYRLGQESAAQGTRWLEQLEEEERFVSGYTFGLGWVVSGGRQDLARWKETLSKKEPLYYAVTSAEVDLLAAIDPHLAAKQVLRLPKSSLRDPVMVKLIERSMYRSEASAKQAEEWLSEIDDSDVRRTMRERVARALGERGEEVTGTVLPEGDNPEFRSQSLGALLERLDTLASMPVSSALSRRVR